LQGAPYNCFVEYPQLIICVAVFLVLEIYDAVVLILKHPAASMYSSIDKAQDWPPNSDAYF